MIIVLLGAVAFLIGVSVVVVQARRGRFFSVLSFYACLFLLEIPGGALKFTLPDVFTDYAGIRTDPSLAVVPLALVISIGGFLLFLYGYLCMAWLLRKERKDRNEAVEAWFDHWWTPGFRLLLFGMTVFVLLTGFIQHAARIRAAGGVASFLANAYLYRAGTATAAGGENNVVVLANLLAASAVALTLIWMFAWLRGRLNSFEKLLAAGIFLLLLVRQVSTMYRAVVIFTLLSFFAAYVSERRIRARQWVLIGGVLFGALVAANFFHLYMYYLTAGWDRYGVVESMSQLLAPHGHLYTLTYVISAYTWGVPVLNGTGLIESIFFFVPRAIWETKLESGSYGTLLVQQWAGLPTHYQMAITSVGELIAHFGTIGMAGMVLLGALYGGWDSLADRSPVARAALYGILLSRVLADAGMGISAVSITIFCFAVFLWEVFAVSAVVWLGRRVVAVPGALLRRGKPGPGGRLIQEGR